MAQALEELKTETRLLADLKIRTGTLEDTMELAASRLGEAVSDAGQTQRDGLDRLDRTLDGISAGLDDLRHDVQGASDRINETIVENASSKTLTEFLTGYRELTERFIADSEQLFKAAEERIDKIGEKLSGTADTLRGYVEDGGVQNSFEFIRAVNELRAVVDEIIHGLHTIDEATRGFHRASRILGTLPEVTVELKRASQVVHKSGERTLKTADAFSEVAAVLEKLRDDLTSVIADNGKMLGEVKEVSALELEQITALKGIIATVQVALTGLQHRR